MLIFASRNYIYDSSTCQQTLTCVCTGMRFCSQQKSRIMMKAKKVLFITQDINPYVENKEMAELGRRIPQALQESGCEIRTFMPKWGCINERRSQLHEVIRLSGMNLIIDDTDHLLIIKVASIPSARMQVYFIDNDDYFQKRNESCDDDGEEYEDNGERAIFYARGVLETVKKLRWVPDIIHCQGWMSSIVPLYVKTAYREEPSFRDSRVIYTPGGDALQKPMDGEFVNSLLFKDVTQDTVAGLPDKVFENDLNRLALDYSDGLLLTQGCRDAALGDYAAEHDLDVLQLDQPVKGADGAAFVDFFNNVWSKGKDEEVEES